MGQPNSTSRAPSASTQSIRRTRKPEREKAKRSAGACLSQPYKISYGSSEPDKWNWKVRSFKAYSYKFEPEFEEYTGDFEPGFRKCTSNPQKYLGLKYQSNMTEWPEDKRKYQLILRNGSGFCVKELPELATFTYHELSYQALKPKEEIVMSGDPYTDDMTYRGQKLGSVFPGRGEGCLDVPTIKVIGDVHPSDVMQGSLADGWLLSALSAIAEVQGAVEHLFQKTPGIKNCPRQDFNTYVVTLFDLQTWNPVDIEVDERLVVKADGTGLLGCQPSMTGELWACYVEKAMAILCGGWDHLEGGHCTHAWRMLTGRKEVYTFMKDTRGFQCYGALNPNSGDWEVQRNSPKEAFNELWPMPWPEAGTQKIQGGCGACAVEDGSTVTDLERTLGIVQMFERMCIWDDYNYPMTCTAAPSASTSDEAVSGVANKDVYTILSCLNNVGGTEIDLIKLRNPSGQCELKSTLWCDGGDGWRAYPQLKEICKPVNANDGVFWMGTSEFFEQCSVVYLLAADMSVYTPRSVL